jgi:hypothetical protein
MNRVPVEEWSTPRITNGSDGTIEAAHKYIAKRGQIPRRSRDAGVHSQNRCDFPRWYSLGQKTKVRDGLTKMSGFGFIYESDVRKVKYGTHSLGINRLKGALQLRSDDQTTPTFYNVNLSFCESVLSALRTANDHRWKYSLRN